MILYAKRVRRKPKSPPRLAREGEESHSFPYSLDRSVSKPTQRRCQRKKMETKDIYKKRKTRYKIERTIFGNKEARKRMMKRQQERVRRIDEEHKVHPVYEREKGKEGKVRHWVKWL